MPAFYEIRAQYDENTITIYQAYRPEIALPAVENNKFVSPFSLSRMTWIKPSFLWMMERSNWAHKPGQEHVLAIKISRAGWEEALSQAVLTWHHAGVYKDYTDWQAQMEKTYVNVQWDPERTIHGKSLDYKSIQVGLSRHIIKKYVNQWTVEIQDYTPFVKKLYNLIDSGHLDKARELLPQEKVYPVPQEIARRLGMLSASYE